MKGGLVVMTAACEALDAVTYTDYESVTVLLNSDEEIGSPTSRELIETEAAKADCVFVFEPARTDRSLVTARKGVGMYTMEVAGRAAHAGADPQAGISAIEELAYKTMAMHRLNDYATGTTVNVGVFQGGTRSNVVAEYAKASIDVRIFTPEEAQRIDQALREIAAEVHVPGAVTTLSGGLNRPPMVKDAGTIGLLELVVESGAELGIQITDVASGGASDGNFTNAAGAPTIDSMGTVGGLAHGISEYSEVDSLLEKIKLTALTAMKIHRIVQ
jgi:glutamate carboxypeptidase